MDIQHPIFYYLSILLIALCPRAVQALSSDYTFTDLAGLTFYGGGGSYQLGRSWATDISENGIVVGYVETYNPGYSFSAMAWIDGSLVALPEVASYSKATSVNSNGLVVGASQTSTESVATVWDVYQGTVQTIPQWIGNTATGINENGTVVGYAGGNNGQGFTWNDLEGMAVMNPQEGSAYSIFPESINNDGQIVGRYTGYFLGNVNTNSGGFFWDGQTYQVINAGDFVSPSGVNDEGQVVGMAFTGSGSYQAFLWEHGQTTYLNSSGYEAYALDINNTGQIVGKVLTGSNATDTEAVIWENGAFFNLNDLLPEDSIWTLKDATGINDKGEIVGWAYSSGGLTRAYVLRPTPVPIPNPALLLSCGIIVIGYCAAHSGKRNGYLM